MNKPKGQCDFPRTASPENSADSTNSIAPGGVKIVFILSLIICFCFAAHFPLKADTSNDLQGKKFNFAENTTLPKSALDFTLTGDGLVIIPDISDGNLKIYEQIGDSYQFQSVVGSQGIGDNQFMQPTFCSFDQKLQKLFIMDHQRGKAFILNRTGHLDFKMVGSIYCPRHGSDLKGWTPNETGRLIIAGVYQVEDGKKDTYALYSVPLDDLSPVSTTFPEKTDLKLHLPLHRKYKMKRPEGAFEDDEVFKKNIAPLGQKAWFDIDNSGNFSYMIWEASLDIMKINLTTGEITTFPAAEKTGKQKERYTEPFVSPDLIRARKAGNARAVNQLMSRMTYVVDLFVSGDYVLVIVKDSITVDGRDKMTYRLQYYSIKSNAFITEKELKGECGWKFSMDRDNGILYSLAEKHIIKFDTNL